MQAKLLRVLETRLVQRLGALKPVPIAARFLAATHRDLAIEVAEGTFREDLLYRLNGITIVLPPLRERSDEIPLLAKRFVDEGAKRLSRSPVALSAAAVGKLQAHSWPGNVRELKNVVERALVLVGDGAVIGADEIVLDAPRAHAASTVARAPATGDGSERARIEAALAEAGGNQTRAAEILGVSRRTLINRLESLGIKRPRKG
jgi:DNA-binding NtrC family response regulator